MSTEVTKVCYRFPVPTLKGATVREALAFYRKVIGKPSEIDEDEGEILGFHYEPLPYLKVNPTGIKNFLRPVKVGDQWGIEVVIGIANLDRNYSVGFQADVLEGKGLRLQELFGALAMTSIPTYFLVQGKVYAYTWYNGVDEPLSFE
jgi:hypothetical protein